MKKKKIKDIVSVVLLIVLCMAILILYVRYMSIVYEKHPEGALNVRLRAEASSYSWIGSMSDEGILYEKDCYVQRGVFGEYYYWVYDICPAFEEGTITLQYKLSHQEGSAAPEECGSFQLQFYVGEDGTIMQVGGAEPPEEMSAWNKFWREYGYLRDQFFGQAYYYFKYILWELTGIIVLNFFEFIEFLSEIYQGLK